MIQFNCVKNQQVENEWHREFKYYLSSRKIELIQEKIISLSEKTTKDEIVDETVGWEIYRNEKYGFEIKYPPVWEYKNGSYPNYPPDWEQPKKAKLFLLFGEPDYTKGDLVEIWIDSSSRLKDEVFKDIKCSKTFLSAKAAQKCGYGPLPLEATPEGWNIPPDMPMVEFKCVEAENNGNFYYLSVGGLTSMVDKFKIFDQMLSSFRFLEQHSEQSELSLQEKQEPYSEEEQQRDTTRKVDLTQTMTALEMYYADKQAYPISNGLEKISDKNCVLHTTIQPTYISDLPLNPLDPEFYYGYKSDGKSYELTARLENLEDENCATQNEVCLYKCKDGKCGF